MKLLQHWLLRCTTLLCMPHLVFSLSCRLEESDGKLVLTTLYGITEITEPVLIKLMTCPAFDRLKQVHQYGVTGYSHREGEYTRYTHSLGVFFLLKKYGASLEEQIDGLLHDVSHTAFSHVGDYVFKHSSHQTSYQDEIHTWFLDAVGITDILTTYGFEKACLPESKKRHHCLEQDKPDLCADRIEYNLAGALHQGLLTTQQVQKILAHLYYKDKQWYFDDTIVAKQFGHMSIQLCALRWGGPWNLCLDYCATQAILRALELGLINNNMIHFSYDDAIWNLMKLSSDATIQTWLKRITQGEQAYYISNQDDYDFHIAGKFSGTDPLVMIDKGLQRLSYLDADYAQNYTAIKEQVARGYYIKFI